MSARIIDGKARAAALRAATAKAVAGIGEAHGFTPGLAVVLVGEDPASKVYVRNKHEQTREVGMNSYEHKLPADTPEAEVIALVEKLNADPAVDGILVQMPLPAHIDEDRVVLAIDPAKDVDGCTRKTPAASCWASRAWCRAPRRAALSSQRTCSAT